MLEEVKVAENTYPSKINVSKRAIVDQEVYHSEMRAFPYKRTEKTMQF